MTADRQALLTACRDAMRLATPTTDWSAMIVAIDSALAAPRDAAEPMKGRASMEERYEANLRRLYPAPPVADSAAESLCDKQSSARRRLAQELTGKEQSDEDKQLRAELVEEIKAKIKQADRLTAPAQPPTGWRLVPVKPTQDMVDAGTDEYWATPHDKVHVGNPSPVVTYYRAMLDAAPPATPQEPQQ